MRPLTSLTFAPESPEPIAATRPSWKPTSVTESRPCDGSITRPPRRTRSSCIEFTSCELDLLGVTKSPRASTRAKELDRLKRPRICS